MLWLIKNCVDTASFNRSKPSSAHFIAIGYVIDAPLL